MQTILAIDPGVGRVGYAVLTKEGSVIKALEYNCIETSSREKLEKRLQEIYERLVALIQLYKPTTMVLEQLFFNNNQKTAIMVGQAQGVMMLAASKNNMATHFITPLEIKQALTGYGASDKAAVQKMMMIILGIKDAPKLDDTADALACGVTYLSMNLKLKSPR